MLKGRNIDKIINIKIKIFDRSQKEVSGLVEAIPAKSIVALELK
jgi:hypothetical protein